MRVTKDGDGVRVRLNLAESHVLEQLLDELRETLDPAALDGPVRDRLYPAGYADPSAQDAYRELTEAGLRAERDERLEQCLADVREGRSLRRIDLTLDADATDRWLRVLNDLRLTLGTRLGISEDDDYQLDRHDPQVQARARYLWLTALQDGLVTAVLP